MSDNAIRAMMAEQSENNSDSDSDASDDAPDFAPSPLTEGYITATGTVDLLKDISMAVADERGHDVEKPSDVTGNFNPNKFTGDGELDEAATAAMDASVFTEPMPIVGLLGAMDALKKRYGGQHPEKVSGEGHHGVGLNTDGTYAKCRDGSYGTAYPDCPHLAQVIGGVEGLSEDEEAFLSQELGIPVTDIGPAGKVLLPAPEGERIPIAFSGDGALGDLADVTDRLNAMPELPGPDGFEGEAAEATGDGSPDDSETPDDSDLPLDVAPFDPREFSVDDCRSRISDVATADEVEAIGAIEEAHPTYDDAVEVEGQTFKGGRKGVHKRLMERSNAISDAVEGVEEEADADDDNDASDAGSVEGADDGERDAYVASLISNGVSPSDAEEAATARFGE